MTTTLMMMEQADASLTSTTTTLNQELRASDKSSPEKRVTDDQIKNEQQQDSPKDQHQQLASLDLTAKPFNPADPRATSSALPLAQAAAPAKQGAAPAGEEPSNPSQGGNAERMDYYILAMKAQHQYIQNLQRANMALKSKIKQLEDIVTRESDFVASAGSTAAAPSKPTETSVLPERQAAQVTTHYDLEQEEAQPIQEMDLMPVGKIEDLAREESQRHGSRRRDERSAHRNGFGGGEPYGHQRPQGQPRHYQSNGGGAGRPWNHHNQAKNWQQPQHASGDPVRDQPRPDQQQYRNQPRNFRGGLKNGQMRQQHQSGWGDAPPTQNNHRQMHQQSRWQNGSRQFNDNDRGYYNHNQANGWGQLHRQGQRSDNQGGHRRVYDNNSRHQYQRAQYDRPPLADQENRDHGNWGSQHSTRGSNRGGRGGKARGGGGMHGWGEAQHEGSGSGSGKWDQRSQESSHSGSDHKSRDAFTCLDESDAKLSNPSKFYEEVSQKTQDFEIVRLKNKDGSPRQTRHPIDFSKKAGEVSGIDQVIDHQPDNHRNYSSAWPAHDADEFEHGPTGGKWSDDASQQPELKQICTRPSQQAPRQRGQSQRKLDDYFSAKRPEASYEPPYEDLEEDYEPLVPGCDAEEPTEEELLQIREEIQRAMQEHNEAGLAQAIEWAKEIGAAYPYQIELDKAESFLHDLMSGLANPQ